METLDIVGYLEEKLVSGEIEIIQDGEVYPIDPDDVDDLSVVEYDFGTKILKYNFDGIYSGKVDFNEVAEKISEKYKPIKRENLEKNWENIISDYFSFGDY